jgi:putative mRNA 3-end processing factor
MADFDTSKANQRIIMSEATRDLLFAIFNADLPYRTNVEGLASGVSYRLDGEIIELFPSNHMLGSVQVRVTCEDGYRVGYSSDFFWPMDEAIEVDELIVDSTYGDPLRNRKFTQELADQRLIEAISRSVQCQTPTAIIGHNGRLQHAVPLMADYLKCPLIASPKVFPLLKVYRKYGHSIPEMLRSDEKDAIALIRARKPCVAFVTLHERRHLPWVDRMRKIVLSAYLSRPEDPLTLYDNGDCCIALTDHADFAGTLQYIQATGAKKVWTDPRSGDAEALATAIRQQLGLEAAAITPLTSLAWG